MEVDNEVSFAMEEVEEKLAGGQTYIDRGPHQVQQILRPATDLPVGAAC